MRRDLWHFSEGLVFAHWAAFLLTYTRPEARVALALIPGAVAARPWTVVTFQLVHRGMLDVALSTLVLWIMARPLEERWGSARLLAFWAVSTAGAAVTAVAFGTPLLGDVFLSGSLLFVFATLFPDTEFLLFFLLPVRVKWLGILGGAALLWMSVSAFGIAGGLVRAAGMASGYLFFLATRRLPPRRKVAWGLKRLQGAAVDGVRQAAAERRNREWDPRVRRAVARAGEGPLGPEDEALLAELDAAVDPSVTVCAPEDFGFVDDPVCRSCPGYAECAARAIRAAAGEGEAPGGE